jgi:hypothetical protein
MLNRQQHLEKARHNERASRAWEAGAFTDWAVTTLFYAALHGLDAYLANSGCRPDRVRRSRQTRKSRRPEGTPAHKTYPQANGGERLAHLLPALPYHPAYPGLASATMLTSQS